MKITVICVGKVKEKFFVQGIDEYKKRLSRYCDFKIVEIADEKTKENASDRENNAVKDMEGERILAKIPDAAYVICMAIDGKMISSTELANTMADIMNNGNSHIVFIIGGSLGLSDKVLARSNFKISFGRVTYPHQLFRLILSEQIYRSFRIMNNEPYHK